MSDSCPIAAQQIAHAAGAVADGVAPMRRRNPLVDDHREPAEPNSAIPRGAEERGRDLLAAPSSLGAN